MEFRSRINRHLLKKIAICLIFVLFVAANVEAGLVAPTITAQPSNTSVQNGDTATFTTSAQCLLSLIGSATWYYTSNNTTRAVYTNTFLVALGSVNSTLTLNNVSSNNVGSYYAEVQDLLGGTVKTSSATLSLIAPVAAVTSESQMMSKGFKVQFSGPTGSNLVIQASSDMVHWTSISTNLIVGGSVTYTDAVAKTQSSRLYRAMIK